MANLSPLSRLGGANVQIGDNRITERGDLTLISVAIPHGGESALEDALKSGWSLTMPGPTRSTTSQNNHAIHKAPDQLLLIMPGSTADEVATKLKGKGYLTDQSDGLTTLDVSGPDTLAALERLCPLDLSLNAFPIGASATTLMEQLSVTVLRLEEARFFLISASSSAEFFLHAVQTPYHTLAERLQAAPPA